MLEPRALARGSSDISSGLTPCPLSVTEGITLTPALSPFDSAQGRHEGEGVLVQAPSKEREFLCKAGEGVKSVRP